MRRHKAQRRTEFAALPGCYTGNPLCAGRWRENLPAHTELIVELAAGRADFSIALAQANPHALVIAVDGKSERLWAGAQRAQAEAVHNIRFLREDILLLGQCFAPAEISRLWITFPDPFPKARHARRRLTSPYFLDVYRRLIAPDGRLEFKTDDPPLFAYTLEQLHACGLPPDLVIADVHAAQSLSDAHPEAPPPPPEALMLTAYERRWLAQQRRTHYLRVPC